MITQVLSICDIVLNHTANESPFLVSHPECTYNCLNCPHLRPAYLLDATLFELTVQVAAGEWEMKGIPPVVETEDHLNVRNAFVAYTSLSDTLIKLNISGNTTRAPHALPASRQNT